MSLTGRLQARISAARMSAGVPCLFSHLSVGRKTLGKGPAYGRRKQFRGSLAFGLPDDVALFGGASAAAASISFVAARAIESSSGVDSATIPLEYDPLRNEAYWRRRPLQVAARSMVVILRGGRLLLVLFLRRRRLQRRREASSIDHTADAEEKRVAVALRETLTALGPLFVKFGQIFSIRSDLLPPIFIAELRQLQDNVPPFPTAVAMAVIDAELPGGSATFQKLSPTPIAAASLGQVYKGTVDSQLGGCQVAVKIQRPGSLELVTLDLFLLRIAAPFLRDNLGLNTDLVALVDEWGSRFVAELDYRKEAENAIQFADAMAKLNLSSVAAPRVIEGASTQRILTTQWIDAERIDRYNSSGSSQEAASLCSKAVLAYLTMLLEVGTLHCDPHPGNLLARDGQLIILDWGLVTYVTPELQNAIIKYIAHLIAKDFDAIATDLVALGFVPKEKIQFMKDTGVVKVVALVFRQLASGGGPSKVNVSTLSAELNSIRAKYGNLLQIPAYFAYILRAFAVLEGLGLSYDPDFSIVDECYPLFTDDSTTSQEALRSILYSSYVLTDAGEVEKINVRRTLRLMNAFQKAASSSRSNEDRMYWDDTDGSSPASSPANEAAREVVKALLSSEGSPLQAIILEESAKIAEAILRESVEFTLDTAAVGEIVRSLPVGILLKKMPSDIAAVDTFEDIFEGITAGFNTDKSDGSRKPPSTENLFTRLQLGNLSTQTLETSVSFQDVQSLFSRIDSLLPAEGVPMAQISVRFYAQLLKRVSLRLEQAGSGVRNVEDSY